MIRTLVVDDEALAREELIRLIDQDKDFKVVAEAGDGAAAIKEMEKGKIDVVFLDIEMPQLSGLDVASRLTEWENSPLVVFATAYHQYAIQAFEAHAIDYVLKPYEPVRLQKTCGHIKKMLESKTPTREKLILLEDDLIRQGHIKKLVGHRRNTKDRIVIDPNDIFYFSVENAGTVAHLATENLMVHSTLKEILENLDSSRFAQTHKATVVNLDKIEKVSPMFSGNFEIHLKDGQSSKISLSRRYAKHIKSLLGNW